MTDKLTKRRYKLEQDLQAALDQGKIRNLELAQSKGSGQEKVEALEVQVKELQEKLDQLLEKGQEQPAEKARQQTELNQLKALQKKIAMLEEKEKQQEEKKKPKPIQEARVRPLDATTQLAKEITFKDGASMVLVPAGRFTMGSNHGNDDEKPQHEVELDAFYMDKYEVTTSGYGRFLESSQREAPRYWETGGVFSTATSKAYGDRPVVGVIWDDAQAYCEQYGKRLPTEAEWEKAARGTDGRTYPWGNDPPTSRHANFDKGYNFKSYGVLTAVGSLTAGKSPYGAYDMAGNVWEWVADWYDKSYYNNSPRKNPRGPSNGEYRVVRGGSWNDEAGNLRAGAPGQREAVEQVLRYRLSVCPGCPLTLYPVSLFPFLCSPQLLCSCSGWPQRAFISSILYGVRNIGVH